MTCIDCGAMPIATTVPEPRCRACAGTYFRDLLAYAILTRHDPPEFDPRYSAALGPILETGHGRPSIYPRPPVLPAAA